MSNGEQSHLPPEADRYYASTTYRPACDHKAAQPSFDSAAAKNLDSYEVRRRRPRFYGECPSLWGERDRVRLFRALRFWRLVMTEVLPSKLRSKYNRTDPVTCQALGKAESAWFYIQEGSILVVTDVGGQARITRAQLLEALHAMRVRTGAVAYVRC